MKDCIYQDVGFSLSEVKHYYGKNVHILSDPFLLSHLAQLCSPKTFQPRINLLVHEIYSSLVKTLINCEFPKRNMAIPTRMSSMHPEAVLEGSFIDPDQRAVTVNLARAGTFPSHICYEEFNAVLNPEQVRQDHISLNRATDELEHVIGTNVSGHKIGGSVKDAIVMFPDPMGATGGTIVSAIDLYKQTVQGPAKKFIALHLIITPEYLERVLKAHPDLIIYAVRLDRGLSSQEVLNLPPGKNWKQEFGLNQKQYIVPGGGGFGEILNNSFV